MKFTFLLAALSMAAVPSPTCQQAALIQYQNQVAAYQASYQDRFTAAQKYAASAGFSPAQYQAYLSQWQIDQANGNIQLQNLQIQYQNVVNLC